MLFLFSDGVFKTLLVGVGEEGVVGLELFEGVLASFDAFVVDGAD